MQEGNWTLTVLMEKVSVFSNPGDLSHYRNTLSGNPIGGLVFSNAFGGKLQQIHEWTNFMSATEFCFRACNPAGNRPAAMCQHIYDIMGCAWNMPARYDAGVFESCQGESGEVRLRPWPLSAFTKIDGNVNVAYGHLWWEHVPPGTTPDPATTPCSIIFTMHHCQYTWLRATGFSYCESI
jgi:hypothetical protein